MNVVHIRWGLALVACTAAAAVVARSWPWSTPLPQDPPPAANSRQPSASGPEPATTDVPRPRDADREPAPGNAASAPRPATDSTVAAADLEAGDAARLASVNRALASARLPTIHAAARIRAVDLPAMRTVVDEAEGRLRQADIEFLNACSAATDPLRKELLAKLSRNETQGLPVMGPDNPSQRSHPHEAITLVDHGGVTYVVRVGPWQDQALAKSGATCDVELERRLRDYTTSIVPLFR